jgi:hypothetical protein
MRLPNACLAVVDREKITEYLLNPEHPDNGGKAVFFFALEFTRDDWDRLAGALRQLTLTADITESMKTVHGKKYMLTDNWRIQPAKRLGCGRFGS